MVADRDLSYLMGGRLFNATLSYMFILPFYRPEYDGGDLL